MKRFHFYNCGDFKASYEEELSLFQTGLGWLWLIIGLILILTVIPMSVNPPVIRILSLMGIYSIAAVGLNIITGYTGMISLGHSAIFGMGAYTAVILASGMNAPFWLAVPAGGLISAIIGIGFGIPAFRLSGFYMCFATLACQKIMEFIFIHWKGLTGGVDGISLPETVFPAPALKNDMIIYYIVFILLALMSWAAVNLLRSKFGRVFLAIKDDRKVAGTMGIPVFKYKLLSFAVGSFYTGIAGALFAYYNRHISPGDFTLSLSIVFIAMIIIGGIGSVRGSIYGAVVIILIKEASVYGERTLSDMFDISLTSASLYAFVTGLLMVLFIILKPKGLAGIWDDICSAFRSWPFSQGIDHGFKR
ncbi:MAG: branched-chain amino acid ABC transporter permease [Deltaproteobacteria bacterium]|nr:branched-chain amino acid ABC transporter permease [Deltaproteobacteria bacterium]